MSLWKWQLESENRAPQLILQSKTSNQMTSNKHPMATASKARHNLKRRRWGYKTNGNIHLYIFWRRMKLCISRSFQKVQDEACLVMDSANHEHEDRISLSFDLKLPIIALTFAAWDQISRTCRVFTWPFTLNTPRYFPNCVPLVNFWEKLLMVTQYFLYKLLTISLITCIDKTYYRSGSQRHSRVVKLLACGARGPGFESRSRHLDFRDWFSPASKSRYG